MSSLKTQFQITEKKVEVAAYDWNYTRKLK